MSNFIKNRRIFTSKGAPAALINDVTTLKNNERKVLYFTEINSDSGTITIPTGATIVLNQFPYGVDALVSTISNSFPTGDNPVTAGSAVVDVTSFDASGNFVLDGIPSSYPVALIYVLKIKDEDWSNLNINNIIEYYDDSKLDKFYGTTYDITNVSCLTAAEYAALGTPDANTIYFIV
jgi:hypothetical protein